MMEIGVDRRDDVVVLRPGGALDAAGSAELQERVTGLLDEGVRRVALDFVGVDGIGSAGIRLLLMLDTKLSGLGGGLALFRVGAGITRALQLARCVEKFTTEGSEDEAITRLRSVDQIESLSERALLLLGMAATRGSGPSDPQDG
jgi:anti-anti-sigma factor